MKVLFLFIVCLLSTAFVLATPWDDGKEWLEISKEYKDEIMEKLQKSKDFSQEQLDVVRECMDESSVKEVLNCFSDGGLDGAAGVLTSIRDELGNIRERICGKSLFGNRDKCDKFGESLIKLKEDLKGAWDATVQRGKQYLEETNKLLFMKRKICKKIDQEGCYQWLNERIEIKCNPKKIGNDVAKIEKCELDVAEDVWTRVSNNQ